MKDGWLLISQSRNFRVDNIILITYHYHIISSPTWSATCYFRSVNKFSFVFSLLHVCLHIFFYSLTTFYISYFLSCTTKLFRVTPKDIVKKSCWSTLNDFYLNIKFPDLKYSYNIQWMHIIHILFNWTNKRILNADSLYIKFAIVLRAF